MTNIILQNKSGLFWRRHRWISLSLSWSFAGATEVKTSTREILLQHTYSSGIVVGIDKCRPTKSEYLCDGNPAASIHVICHRDSVPSASSCISQPPMYIQEPFCFIQVHRYLPGCCLPSRYLKLVQSCTIYSKI